MAAAVRLTIKGAGEAGENAPTVDDLLGQVRDFVEVLQGVEKALTDDHTNQIVWRVTDAERQNPISFELTPFAINPAVFLGTRAEEVERAALEGFASLRSGNTRPAYFTDDVISKARKIHKRITNGLAETTILIDEVEPFVIDHEQARQVERAFEKEKAAAPIPYRELGSVEGFLSKAELDGHGRAILRFWSRLNGAEIKAVATGQAFRQIEALRLSDVWHGIRVRIYGTINYKSLGIIEGVNATGIEVLDQMQLPGVDDIVDPTFTGGLSVEEFLAEQRRD